MWKRIRNLWYLSSLEIASDSFRQIKLTVPAQTSRTKKKLATIIEDKPDMFKQEFKQEEVDNETIEY